MKKIYTIVILSLLSVKASAQSDLAILHNVQTGDTIKIKPTNPPQYSLAYGFVNHGPNALTQSDTIFLSTPYNTFKLTLPSAGVPVNDTVFFADTVGFTTGPASGPGQWCDSIWAKNSSNAIIVDPVISNNKLCTPIYILNLTTGISEKFGTAKSGTVTSLTIYPNPAVNSIGFDYNVAEISDATVVVTDLTGRMVYQQDLGKVYGAQKLNIDVSSFSNGIYILELRVDGVKSIGKFVIQK